MSFTLYADFATCATNIKRHGVWAPAFAGTTGRNSRSQHSQRLHVGFQDGFLFRPLVGVLLAQAHDGAQRLDVEAVALGLGIDVADVVRDGLLLFFQPLDALDDGLELIFREFGRGLFLDGGSEVAIGYS